MIFLFIFFCCIFGPVVGQKRKDSDLNYPDCGKRSKPDSNLDLGAYTSEPGNFPWHVGIYKYDKFAESYENICGGSIIAPHIVLTAAKCVYDPGNKTTFAPTFFKVVAGKISFDWSTPDPNAQEVTVNEIAIPDTYLGDTSSYAENIAALKLVKDFVFNDLVTPVCWVLTRRRDNSASRILQTAGWGLKGAERYSETLKEANLEYINIVECRQKYTSIRYLRFINYDKLCVLTPRGRKDYDTGAGLVQKKGDRYYLMAILSANINNDFSPSTNISRHFGWVSRTVSRFNSQKRCNDGGFLCRDGTTCLGEEYVCDGIRHCRDGSDEISDSCPTPITRDSSLNSRGSCKLPSQRGGVTYTRLNCQIDCEMKAGMFIRSNEIVRINCGLGFGPATDKQYDSKYICSNGSWFDREPECIKLCPTLKREHLTFECVNGGSLINCDNFMRPGTIAKFRCNKFYRPNYDPVSFTDSTVCQIGGTWNEKLPTCFPVCGIVNQVNKAVPTLFWANKTTYGEYPWHVGIFLNNGNRFENICGGSLISENFVLTAAHCMFDPNAEKFKPENLKVAAGKAKRDFYTKERYQVDSDVMNIITPDTYAGFHTRYEEDIALVKTVISFKFNDFILPVCIDRYGTVTFNRNIKGLVVGWGLTEEHVYSDDLREAHLPIMPIVECRDTFKDFVQFITSDKFCVIHQNGTGTQMGDSGGGMTFDVGGVHYIHGIVSVKKTDSNLFSVFTNVTAHLPWIYTSMKAYSPANRNT